MQYPTIDQPGRTLPNSIEAENYLLSCILMDGPVSLSAAIEAGVTPSTFYSPANGVVYEQLLEMSKVGKSIAVETLAICLQGAGRLESIGGYHYLTQITESGPTTLQRSVFIARLITLEKLRTIIREGTGAIETSFAGGDDALAEAGMHITRIQTKLAGTDGDRVKTLAESAEAAAMALESPLTAFAVPTAWPAWDRLATPLKAGEMVTIAARPGFGKTAIALQMADKVAQAGKNVLLFSLEMMGEELANRLALQREGRSILTDDKKKAAALRKVGSTNSFHVFDARKTYNMDGIEARARVHSLAKGGVGLIVIDYLQLIVPTDRRANREQQVAEMSRRCKQMAGHVGCPVIVLAQLNREAEKHARRPILSDLRESGAIEQDSDRVWFIHQDPKDCVSPESSTQEVALIQAKCRGGPPNVGIKFRFDMPVFTFTPVNNTVVL